MPRPPTFCSVDGCESQAHARSLCRSHYFEKVERPRDPRYSDGPDLAVASPSPGVSATGQYQLFDPLRAEEYDALKADIQKRGVLVPVEVDDDGNILDGHHRVLIADSLGIEYPRVVRHFDSESEKREHVLKINLLRRHLGPVSWATAFERLAAERGIVLGSEGGRPSEENPATVAGLAQEVGVPVRTARRRLATKRQLESRPDLAEKVDSGEMPAKRAMRVVREDEARERVLTAPEPNLPAALDIRLGDFRDTLSDIAAGSVDAVVTDPPYPREFIDLFSDLGKFASDVLTPSGVLAVMVGQSHLRDYMALLDEHLAYRWVGAYIVQGPRNRVHHARVGTGWKPVLLYQRKDAETPPFLLDDVFTSTADDKRFHHWGQSESGFAAIIERVTKVGGLVVDPFLGGGTTAVVCKELKRRFIGCDLDEAAVATSKQRVA